MQTKALVTWRRVTAISHVREFVASIGFGLGAYALALLSGPSLSRALGVTGKGQQAFILVVSQTVAGIATSGIPNAAYFHLERAERGKLIGTTYALMLFVLTCFSIPVLIFLPQVVNTADYGPSAVVWLRAALALNGCLVLASCALAIIQSGGTGLKYNILRFGPQIAAGLAVIALFIMRALDLQSALYATVVLPAVLSLGVLFFVKGSTKLGFDRKLCRSLSSYGARALGGVAAIMTVNNADKLILGSIDVSKLGVYSVAASASGVLVPIGFGAGSTVLSQLRRNEREPLAVLRHTVLGTAAVAGATSLVLAVAAPFVIPGIFGEEFSGAVVPLYFMLPGVMGMAIENVLQAYLYAMGYPGRATRSAMAGGVMMLITVGPAIRHFSMVGAATATTLSLFTQLAVTALTVRKIGNKKAGAT